MPWFTVNTGIEKTDTTRRPVLLFSPMTGNKELDGRSIWLISYNGQLIDTPRKVVKDTETLRNRSARQLIIMWIITTTIMVINLSSQVVFRGPKPEGSRTAGPGCHRVHNLGMITGGDYCLFTAGWEQNWLVAVQWLSVWCMVYQRSAKSELPPTWPYTPPVLALINTPSRRVRTP